MSTFFKIQPFFNVWHALKSDHLNPYKTENRPSLTDATDPPCQLTVSKIRHFDLIGLTYNDFTSFLKAIFALSLNSEVSRLVKSVTTGQEILKLP